MKIVRAYDVQTADVTSTATESVSAWNSGTTYAEAQQARKGTRIWQSVQNSNLNHDPETDDGTWWLEYGPTNTWAMFDSKTGTQTTASTSLEVTVDTTGFIDTIGLLNLDGASVNVTMMEGATEVYNVDHSLVDDSAVVDWYEYYFEPIIRKTDLVISGLPDVLDPSITVTITDTDTVAIGHFVAGLSRYIGETRYGARIGITDYSRFEEDSFGNTYVVERAFNRTGNFDVILDASRTDATYNLVNSYRATPILIVATDDYASTFYFGLLKNATIEFTYPSHSILSVEVRGF